jgi:hypothetical protein
MGTPCSTVATDQPALAERRIAYARYFHPDHRLHACAGKREEVFQEE